MAYVSGKSDRPLLSTARPKRRWYHHEDHPVHALFRRQASNSTANSTETYPAVGSSEWTALFPPSWTSFTANTPVPQPWLDALNNAVTQGLIPNIPVPVMTPVNPQYPNGTDPKGPEVCSATWFCRQPEDVWDAPDGEVGIAFDDGPLPDSSPMLYSFLKENNLTAMHFMIGSNILANPSIFLQAYGQNDEIGCHTYNHPYMTTLTNNEVVLELGWQMEMVRVSTGGRIPRIWRPPYGDVDNRVRAIASHVFGLTTVFWNHDSLDWELPAGPVTPAGLQQNYTLWYSGPKSPGLIILSHELTTDSVNGWITAYPMIAANGWVKKDIGDLLGVEWYLNAQNDTTSVNQSLSVAVPQTTSSTSTPSNTATGVGASGTTAPPSKSGELSPPASTIYDFGLPALIAAIGLYLL